MIPVNQSRTGLTGNCFEACVASILGLALHQVPDFGDDAEFMENVEAFLLPMGKFYFTLDAEDPQLERIFEMGTTWHIGEGISERGGPHACVYMNGMLVHDPHPGGRGLRELHKFGFLGDRGVQT